MCAECERRGKVELAVHVDHMIPFSHAPELRLEPSNLQSLCIPCHHGWKFRMERYAAKAKKMDDLADWCKNPQLRPKVLR